MSGCRFTSSAVWRDERSVPQWTGTQRRDDVVRHPLLFKDIICLEEVCLLIEFSRDFSPQATYSPSRRPLSTTLFIHFSTYLPFSLHFHPQTSR